MAQTHGLKEAAPVAVEGGQLRQDAPTAVDLIAQEGEILIKFKSIDGADKALEGLNGRYLCVQTRLGAR